MIKSYTFLILLAAMFAVSGTYAQSTTISTAHTSNNSSSHVTFNVENTNGFPIRITAVSAWLLVNANNNWQILYNPTAVNSSGSSWTQGIIGAGQNGWVSAATGTIAVGTAGVNILSTTLDIVIPAGATYGMCIGATSIGYMTLTAGAGVNIFAGGGVNLKTGDNISWGGAYPPSTPTNYPRGFVGSITLEPIGPCPNPPTPGTVTSNFNPACSGAGFILSLVGGTGGTGQTYQWQSSSDNVNFTSIAGAITATYSTSQTSLAYYRAVVTCGASVTSTSLLITTPPLISGTFTINSAVATGGTNFQTFTEAINYIKCGINGPVVFNVNGSSGPYNEQIVIPQIGGTSLTNTITFNGNGRTLSFSSANTNLRSGILLDGADYITINNLVIDGSAGTYGWGVQMINQANNNTISNCTINVNSTVTTSYNFLGIVIGGSATTPISAGNAGNNNALIANTITGGYYPVILYGASAAPFGTGNVVTNNIIRESYSYGIYVYGNVNGSISRNDISRPTRTNSTTTAGVFLTTGCAGLVVEKNRIHNLFDAFLASTSTTYGIYHGAVATAGQENKLINNLIYNMNGNGIVYGIYNTTGPYMQAYHNTIVLDDQATTTGAAYGLYQTGSAAGLQYRNNIIYLTRAGTGIKRCIYFVTTTSTIISNNNDLFLNSPGGTNNNVGQWGTTNYATLTDWKTANTNAYDQQSLSMDPLFTNPGGGDFKPTNGGMDNFGTPVGVTTDINGDARSGTAPDLGAYEFAGPGCVSPPTPGISIFSPLGTICPNTQIALDLSGNSVGSNQTYQWQSSTSSGGTYVPISGSLSAPSFSLMSSGTLWYRAAVTCGVNTQYSAPVQVVVAPLFPAGTYTINSAVATGGLNYQTFSDAVNAIKCGISGPVVFNINAASGPYNEQIAIPQIGGTSITSTITFNGNGRTLSFNSANTNSRAGITLDGADYITINNLVIDGSAGTYGWGIQMLNQANNNMINGCTINVSTTVNTAYNFLGIVIGGSATTPFVAGNAGNNNTIVGNTIIGGYYPVILYGASAAPYNIGNVVTNNIIRDAYSYSIYLLGNVGTTVSRNDISRPTKTTSTTTAGVFITTGCSGVLVEKNKVHNMFDAFLASTSTTYAFYVAADGAAGQENRIINNLVYNMNGNGVVYGIYNTTGPFMQAYHNSIVLDDPATTTGAAYGIYQTGASAGQDYRNNLIYLTRAGTGIKRCFYFVTTTSTILSNNNNLYLNSSGGTNNNVGQYGTTNYATLTDWKTANGNAYDQQSWDMDPSFTNPGAGDFTPTNSLLDNKGIGVGVTTDISGNSRDITTPDIGAYEFSSITAGVNMSAEALVNPPVSATGCYSSNETVGVRIRNLSSSTIDFSVNPVTITVNVTGATTQSLNKVVNTGILASNSTLDVSMNQVLDMSTVGTYTFNANVSVGGDVNPTNDAMPQVIRTKVALNAGTASASPGGYCVTGGSPTLSATGLTGYSALQWQQSISSGSGFSNIPGATTVPYTLQGTITQTRYFRLTATCSVNSSTSGETIVTLTNPQVTGTTPGARCGSGTVNLGATGSAGTTLKWYAAPTGGTELGTGSPFTTPGISTSTTYYVEANEAGGSTGAAPIVITEMDLGTDDKLEIQNVSGNVIDVTGWKIAVGNSYTDINSVNANVQSLTGTMAPGDIKTWTDNAAGPNYWGSNILWNPGVYPTFTGWAAILDNNGTLVDIVFLNWPSSNIQAASLVIGAYTISVGSKWGGNGIDQSSVLATQSVSRQGSFDNNTLSDFSVINLSLGSTNPGMTIPFTGFGCSSVRVPVTATVNPGYSLAGTTGGAQVCSNVDVGSGNTYMDGSCKSIVTITPNGASPVSGLINACVKIDATVQSYNLAPYVQRHYDLEPAVNPAGATARITLYFTQQEFNNYNAAAVGYPGLPTSSTDNIGKYNLKVTQYHGSGTAPGNYSGGMVLIDPVDADIVYNPVAARWEVSFNATGFSGFYVHAGFQVLPVTLINFTAKRNGMVNDLNWSTSQEVNSSHFVVERSVDGISFYSIGQVMASVNSPALRNYHFTDINPVKGMNYYRLRLVDIDNKSKNSIVLALKNGGVSTIDIYPNPVKDMVRVDVDADNKASGVLMIMDISGKKVYERSINVIDGSNSFNIDVSNLSTGTYIIKILLDKENQIKKFTKL